MNYENPFNQQISEQQIIQKIKSEIVSIVNNEILKLKQELKSELKESETTTTKKKPYTVFSSEDMVIKNYNNNVGLFNYTITPPESIANNPNVNFNEKISSIYAQVKFFSPNPHILGLRDGKFYWIEDDCVDLTLYKKTDGTPPNESQQIWISAGTVAGGIPEGLDPSYGKYLADSGSGNAWVEVNIDGNTGEIVSVAVAGGGSTPQNTNTSFYLTLGYYEYNGDSPSITNYGCGSVEVTVCRNWFAAESPFYGVTFNR